MRDDTGLDCSDLPTKVCTDHAVLDCADLSNADLTDAVLAFASLRNARLSDAVLRRADLTGADVRGAELSWASLKSADLLRARLDGARLDHGDLTRASLNSARLVGASLLGARLRLADLAEADLEGASLVDVEATGAVLPGNRELGRFVDLRGARLTASHGVAFEDSFAMHAELDPVYRLFDKSHSPLSLDITDVGPQDDFRQSDLRAALGTLSTDACKWQLLLDPTVSCMPHGKRVIYEEIAKKIIQEMRATTNPYLRTALLDKICGRSLPRLRDLEEAFRNPPGRTDLVAVLKTLPPEIAHEPCAPLDRNR